MQLYVLDVTLLLGCFAHYCWHWFTSGKKRPTFVNLRTQKRHKRETESAVREPTKRTMLPPDSTEGNYNDLVVSQVVTFIRTTSYMFSRSNNQNLNVDIQLVSISC